MTNTQLLEATFIVASFIYFLKEYMDNFRQYIKEAHLKDDDGYEFELTEDKLKIYFYIFNDNIWKTMIAKLKHDFNELNTG